MNSVVALQLAPQVSWPDAMGMVVLAGLCTLLLVATGMRERVMAMIPDGMRKAITMGIGLFILLIGPRRPPTRCNSAPTATSTAGPWSSSSSECCSPWS